MKNPFDKLRASQQGFTLIELLVVIGILAILLAITLFAINPSQHFKAARDTQRQSDVNAILDSIYEYEAANTGNQPAALAAVSTTAEQLKKGASVSATGTTFFTPTLTYTVPSGNTTTSGSITVTSCTNSGNNGVFAVTSGTTTTIVVSNTSGVASDTTCVINAGVNMCALTPTYIADLPMDPSATAPTGGTTPCAGGTTAYNTKYTIAKSATGSRFTVAAPLAELSTISVTR